MPKRLTLEDLRDKRKKHEKVGDLELIQAILDKFEFFDKQLKEVMGTHAANFEGKVQELRGEMHVALAKIKLANNGVIETLDKRVETLEKRVLDNKTNNNMKGDK